MDRKCTYCADTGVVVTNTLELGDPIIRADCECAIGRAFTALHLGPLPGTSHQLGEQAIDRHRVAMKAAGRWECRICDHTWHEDGEACPIASKPSGWIHPDYRKGETA